MKLILSVTIATQVLFSLSFGAEAQDALNKCKTTFECSKALVNTVVELKTDNEKLHKEIDLLKKQIDKERYKKGLYGLKVLSTSPDGQYFCFNSSDFDEVIGADNWHENEYFAVRSWRDNSGRRATLGNARFWSNPQGDCTGDGDAHGRWGETPGYGANQWKHDDIIYVLRQD